MGNACTTPSSDGRHVAEPSPSSSSSKKSSKQQQQPSIDIPKKKAKSRMKEEDHREMSKTPEFPDLEEEKKREKEKKEKAKKSHADALTVTQGEDGQSTGNRSRSSSLSDPAAGNRITSTFKNNKSEATLSNFKLSAPEDVAERLRSRFDTTLFGELSEKDTLFKWSEKYELGVSMIDKQHFKLVQLMNELNYAESEGSSGRWVIGYALESLISYTDYHFKDEEKLMEHFEYEPETMKGHKKKHRLFVSTILQFRDKFMNMEEMDVGSKVLAFLKDWLINHILHTDVKLCAYVKERIMQDEFDRDFKPEETKDKDAQ